MPEKRPGVIYDKEVAGVGGLGRLAGNVRGRRVDLKPSVDRGKAERVRAVVPVGTAGCRVAVGGAQNSPTAASGVVVERDDIGRVCLRSCQYRRRRYREGAEDAHPRGSEPIVLLHSLVAPVIRVSPFMAAC
jgi:hypothetical protein